MPVNKFKKTVMFKDWECSVILAKYGNNAPAIQLIDAKDQEPVGTATVNIVAGVTHPAFKTSDNLPENECYIKTWAENQGILEVLVDAGVLEFSGLLIPVGPYGSQAALCKINVEDFKTVLNGDY